MLAILFADKYAVFTYKEALEDPEYQTSPVFTWRISDKSSYFFKLIKDRIKAIESTNNIE